MKLKSNINYLPASIIAGGAGRPGFDGRVSGVRCCWVPKKGSITVTQDHEFTVYGIGYDQPVRQTIPAGSRVRCLRRGSPESHTIWEVSQ